MNEAILLFMVITLLVLPAFFIKSAKKSLMSYIKIASVFILLLLIWLFDNEGKLSVKVILSALAITVLYREYLSLKKIHN